jgi:hypothetical protein
LGSRSRRIARLRPAGLHSKNVSQKQKRKRRKEEKEKKMALKFAL